MKAIDTNILVYAHRLEAPKNQEASAYLEGIRLKPGAGDAAGLCLVRVSERRSAERGAELTHRLDAVVSWLVDRGGCV